MSDAIMQLAGVIQRDINNLDAVAQNIANANTPGYRAGRTFSTLIASPADAQPLIALEYLSSRSTTQLGGGAIQTTGISTDLALDGDAWFLVSTPAGTALTRNGELGVDTQGYLVTRAGQHRLLGSDGPIFVPEGDLTVDSSGGLTVMGERIDSLQLVSVSRADSLVPLGDGLYRATGALKKAQSFNVTQGAREASNVAIGEEMVRIMEISRHVETMQRALSAYDDMLNSGINQLGKD
tara:strand:+ start:6015 stop:6728 length:714 start_codon:yes stop_codon:yes gene_type:complete